MRVLGVCLTLSAFGGVGIIYILRISVLVGVCGAWVCGFGGWCLGGVLGFIGWC